jgi:hypothetical protein
MFCGMKESQQEEKAQLYSKICLVEQQRKALFIHRANGNGVYISEWVRCPRGIEPVAVLIRIIPWRATPREPGKPKKERGPLWGAGQKRSSREVEHAVN